MREGRAATENLSDAALAATGRVDARHIRPNRPDVPLPKRAAQVPPYAHLVSPVFQLRPLPRCFAGAIFLVEKILLDSFDVFEIFGAGEALLEGENFCDSLALVAVDKIEVEIAEVDEHLAVGKRGEVAILVFGGLAKAKFLGETFGDTEVEVSRGVAEAAHE